MNILKVPEEYRTIQGAIDAASPGDKINVGPGFYVENILINKDNLTIIGYPDSVIKGNSAVTRVIDIEANNTTISGFQIINNNTAALYVVGDYNKVIYFISVGNRAGIITIGKHNLLESCVIQDSTSLGIGLTGDYNQIVTAEIQNNFRGILVASGSFSNNIFYKNIITNNQLYGIKICNPLATKTVFKENTISNSPYGIDCEFGQVAFIGNRISNINEDGITYKSNCGVILENIISNCNIAMNLETCNSLIAGNSATNKNNSGFVITGSSNNIVSNVAISCEDCGLLINGCKNNICNNKSINNGVDNIINGNNSTDCKYTYCAQQVCNNTNKYLELLNIFKQPVKTIIN